MSYISEREEKRLRRALSISAIDDREAMEILKNIIIEKNAEIARMTARAEYLYRENVFIESIAEIIEGLEDAICCETDEEPSTIEVTSE